MDDQAQVPAVAAMAEYGCPLVHHGGVRPSAGHGIGDGFDALDALDGADGNPVVHGNYDCVSCTAVEYPLQANRCSSQFGIPISV